MAQINGSMLKSIKKDILLNWDRNASREDAGNNIYSQPPSDSNNGSNEQSIVPSVFKTSGWWGPDLAEELSSLFDDNNSNDANRLLISNAVHQDKNITRLMADIADSVTNFIRTGPNQTKIYGTAYYPEVFVVVRWQWCILPGALIVLSAVFFSLTVWDSRVRYGSRPPLWKSNLLPFLFYDLEGWTREEMRVPEDSAALKEAAERMMAKMETNEEGDRRFVRVDALRSDENLDGSDGQTLAEGGIPLRTIDSQSTR